MFINASFNILCCSIESIFNLTGNMSQCISKINKLIWMFIKDNLRIINRRLDKSLSVFRSIESKRIIGKGDYLNLFCLFIERESIWCATLISRSKCFTLANRKFDVYFVLIITNWIGRMNYKTKLWINHLLNKHCHLSMICFNFILLSWDNCSLSIQAQPNIYNSLLYEIKIIHFNIQNRIKQPSSCHFIQIFQSWAWSDH